MLKEKERKKTKKNGIKYRISILNNNTHESLYEFKVKINYLVSVLISMVLIYSFIIIAIFFFTPAKTLIPGYPDINIKTQILKSKMQRDSILNEMRLLDLHVSNINTIIAGEKPINIDSLIKINKVETNITSTSHRSKADSTLREIVTSKINNEKKDNYSEDRYNNRIEGLHMFKPAQGVVTTHYNIAKNHPFTDISTTENTVASSILPGTIISSDYTTQFGYSIYIQHSNNLISVYRHISKATANRGDKVKSGATIGLIGKEGGTISSGIHLHFELWHNGTPIDAEKYIKF